MVSAPFPSKKFTTDKCPLLDAIIKAVASICEEKGSGLDKVIFYNELYQLPAINVVVAENRTRVTMYCYKALNNLDKKEKIRACYQHACLKYVSNEKMTNQSLRERFKIDDHNYSIASRIIRDAIDDKVIKNRSLAKDILNALYLFDRYPTTCAI